MLEATRPGSCLDAAGQAISVIHLANRSLSLELRDKSNLAYAQGVSAVNVALTDPDLRYKDETLVAIWLLGQRERFAQIGHFEPQDNSAVEAHINGVLLLLHLRGEEQFTTSQGRHLYKLFLSNLQWHPLLACEEPSEQYRLLEAQIGKATLNIPDASARVSSFFRGVTKLRARIRNWLVSTSGRQSDDTLIVSYLKAGERLERKVVDWCDEPGWRPLPVAEKETRDDDTWLSRQPFCSIYFVDTEGFSQWNRYYAAKICLYAAIIDALVHHEKRDSCQKRCDLYNIQDMIHQHTLALHGIIWNYLGMMSYGFGDIDESGRSRWRSCNIAGGRNHPDASIIKEAAMMEAHPLLSYLSSLGRLAIRQKEAIDMVLNRLHQSIQY
ncbi:uncharacterized protein AB675_3896 [Cyphellophora attinorum]|uniref:Uncharacterized protein n=1 Tax=Cyphellophora attinorum TaxID=1664694 RepID=A0A0N0NHL8_9EURO|nr:uncharacterized protein AB675_3896 [Phialophora attinorum]KPI34419.1 hypothetical protein AB675_3896 [Phialophora attinorum]